MFGFYRWLRTRLQAIALLYLSVAVLCEALLPWPTVITSLPPVSHMRPQGDVQCARSVLNVDHSQPPWEM